MGPSSVCISVSQGLLAITLLLLIVLVLSGFCSSTRIPHLPGREKIVHIGEMLGACSICPLEGEITLSILFKKCFETLSGLKINF